MPTKGCIISRCPCHTSGGLLCHFLQVLELLTEHLAQWATSISFPELSHLPCVVLRGFIKGCAVERFRRQAKQLVDALERNATYVGNARDGVTFAPQDLAAAATFLSSDKERAQVRGGLLLTQHWAMPGQHHALCCFCCGDNSPPK
jgi:hypothetical protein